mmetsp:Transcript_12401/g.21484  ORF Transcript_12401/g.21484 Transcript_12401/m.21484 type:complete len:82 (+) Transcript_12401:62-307(+)
MKYLVTIALVLPPLVGSFQPTPSSWAPCRSRINDDEAQSNDRPAMPTAKRKWQRRQHPSSTQLSMCQLMGMNCAALTDFTF